jgi:hypothetical protein
VRGRIKSPIARIIRGGPPGSLDAVCALGPWDPPRQRHDVVGGITRRRRPRLDLPSLTVHSTPSAPSTSLSLHRRSCLLLAVAAPLSLLLRPPALCYSSLNDRSSDATGERERRWKALEGLGVCTPADRPERIQALTARAWRGILAPAEPSSDTPVVLLPGMWSGLPGQVLKPACLKLQAASALTSPHSSAGGGFSVPAGFSRDRWRRRNHLQLPRLFVCLPEAFQSVIQGMTGSPVTPSWRGSLLFRTQHPLWPQLLCALKAAYLLGFQRAYWEPVITG